MDETQRNGSRVAGDRDFEWVNQWYDAWSRERDTLGAAPQAAHPGAAHAAPSPGNSRRVLNLAMLSNTQRIAREPIASAPPEMPPQATPRRARRRFPDPVPVILGTTLGTMILTAFGTAALFMRLVR